MLGQGRPDRRVRGSAKRAPGVWGEDAMSVKEIIDRWDPIGLLTHAPDDEYHSEISEITELLNEATEVRVVADGIYSVFLRAFGEVFSKTREECSDIARLILKTTGSCGSRNG
jgi:hypothetical protein